MNYLLPAQTLLDLCASGPTAALTWAAPMDTTTVRVCVISIAEAQSAIEDMAVGPARIQLDARLSGLLNSLEADTGPPLAFDQPHADMWRLLLNEPGIQGVGATDLQVYAIAMHEGLTVVEQPHAHTAALQQLNVKIRVL